MKIGRVLTVLAICLAAALLRLPDLAERPMHANEAMHADRFGALLESGQYRSAPDAYPGAVLAYLTFVPALARDQVRYLSLDETTLRLAPALLGVLLALAPLLLAGGLDRKSLALASAFIAVSPAFVYYSRCYIPETPLVFFTALAIAAGWRFAQTGRLAWAVAAGVALGLMLATRETAVIVLAGLAIACGKRLREAGRRPLIAGTAAAAGVAGMLLSSFFLNPVGPLNSVRTLFVPFLGRAFGGSAHQHPWHFYFAALVCEWPVLVLAAVGVWRAVREREPLLRFLGVYALATAAIYSALPSKSPCCVLSFWYPAIIFAGAGAAWLLRTPEIGLRLATAVVLIVGFGHLSRQAWSLAGPEATDASNPYADAQTGADVLLIRDRVGQLARLHSEGERMPVQIVASEDLWPLPWYLRRYPNLSWRRAVPDKDTAVAPLVLLTPDFQPALLKRLSETPPAQRDLYMSAFDRRVELRPGLELRGFAVKGLRDRVK